MALFVLVGDRERADRRLLPWLAVGTNTALAVALVVPSRTAVLERTTGYVALGPAARPRGRRRASAAVAVVVLTRVSRWEHGGLVALGGLTYPLYLVHEYWGLGVIRAARGPGARGRGARGRSGRRDAAWPWAVHRYVEVPCGPYLRRETLALLEGARSVRARPPDAGATAGPGDGLTRQAPGIPPTGPAGRDPSRIAAQKAGARSGSSRTVEPTSARAVVDGSRSAACR